jgi:hypothetical protein
METLCAVVDPSLLAVFIVITCIFYVMTFAHYASVQKADAEMFPPVWANWMAEKTAFSVYQSKPIFEPPNVP